MNGSDVLVGRWGWWVVVVCCAGSMVVDVCVRTWSVSLLASAYLIWEGFQRVVGSSRIVLENFRGLSGLLELLGLLRFILNVIL